MYYVFVIALCYFVLCEQYVLGLFTDMASYPLLNPMIDGQHRATLMAQDKQMEVLQTRTPVRNWMVHRAWVQRFVYNSTTYIFLVFCMTH